MILRRLDLIAFGPFSGTSIDFTAADAAGDGSHAAGRGVHVVYGPNEAGKSTTLRALGALLYGFPHTTPDAHRHAMQDLRVGGELGDTSGARLVVVRRKGKKDTLLDPGGKAIDEGALRKLLGGVGAAQFQTMFGLDHRALREGARDLLEGRGDLGESLFSASLGGSGLHELRQRLADEHAALFTPQAWQKPLNKSLKELQEAQKTVRTASLEEEAWRKQERGIEEARADKRRLEEEHREVAQELARAARVKMVLPMLEKRKGLLARRHAMGAVILLDPGARREREDASRVAEEAGRTTEALERDVARLSTERAALRVPESLLAAADAIEELSGRLGSHQKAARDLPKLCEERRSEQDEATAILRRIGRDLPLSEIGQLRVDTATQARIRALALKPAALEAAHRLTSRSLDAIVPQRDAHARALARLPATPDATDLARVTLRAQRALDLPSRAGRAARDATRLDKAVCAQATSLLSGLVLVGSAQDAAALAALPVPSAETAERWSRTFGALEEASRRVADRQEDSRSRRVDRGRELSELQRAGAVPSEDDLTSARAHRDLALRRVRVEHRAGDRGADALAKELEDAVRVADEIGDRLRREASRVARVASLVAELEAIEEEHRAAAAELSATEVRRVEAEAAWQQAWAPAGVSPLSPSEMLGWLARHRALGAAVAELETLRAEEAVLTAELGEHEADLRRALEAGSGSSAVGLDRFDRLFDAAARRKDEIERDERTRADTEAALGALAREEAELTVELRSQERALAEWRAAWGRALAPLGLGPEATPEEATALLGEIAELQQRAQGAERLDRRVKGIERDAAELHAAATTLARDHAPDLLALSPDAAAAQLVHRHLEGRTQAATRREIDRQLDDKRASLELERSRRDVARARLEELCREAGAGTVADLERAEEQSAKARELDRQLAELEDHLAEAGEGRSTVELARELAAVDADALEASILELEERVAGLERRREAQTRDLVSFELGLEQLRKGSAEGATAAAEVEACLARLRGQVERYVQLRLAAAILGREIERYRVEHQGPVMTRASDLFRRLTLDSFAGLRPGFGEGDEPVLLCVRADGREVRVEGLSEGARDQLYLALRLASLERHLGEKDPMPLVIDDVLMTFDDDRARAALAVFSEIGERTQVLIFTHHARLVELAREAIPAANLGEHVLGWVSGRGS